MAKLDMPTKLAIALMVGIVVIFAFVGISNYKSGTDIVCELYANDDNVTIEYIDGDKFYLIDNGFGDQLRVNESILEDSCLNTPAQE